MRLPITPDTLHNEVESAGKILTAIQGRLGDIPGVDSPGSEEQTVEFLREVCGELMVAANKCQGLASILADLTV